MPASASGSATGGPGRSSPSGRDPTEPAPLPGATGAGQQPASAEPGSPDTAPDATGLRRVRRAPASERLDRTKILAARLRAASERPYLAAALYSLSLVASDQVPTMGVDRRWRCYVAPAFVDATPVPQLAAVWLHEVAHLLRDHHGRADRLPAEEQGNHARVNIAQDCEINDDLAGDLAGGALSLPPGGVTPGTFELSDGLLFEAYLTQLPVFSCCTCGDQGDTGQGGAGQGDGPEGSGQPDGQQGAGRGHAGRHVPGVDRDCVPVTECGSGAHGVSRPWDLGDASDADVPGVQEVEAEAIRRHTAESVRQHQRSRGNVPAGWQRWAEQVLEPQVDWRRVLTGAVRAAVAWASGAVDYAYGRPSRRSAALRGVVLPSLRRPLPRVAIVVDTSGSMGPDDLAAALGEVTGVLRSVGVRGNRVNVLACDADVHAARRVTSVEQVALAGGGGTDMRVGIDQALAVPDPPHVVVVLTDGYTPWPEQPPAARVIAGLVGEDPPDTPAWMETVRIQV